MIHFIDFEPNIKFSAYYGRTADSFTKLVKEMNKWMEDNTQYSIVNVETLLLPNIMNGDGTDANLLRSKENNYWVQVLRVWYTE